MTEVYNHFRFLSVKVLFTLSILSFSVFWELSGSDINGLYRKGKYVLSVVFSLF